MAGGVGADGGDDEGREVGAEAVDAGREACVGLVEVGEAAVHGVVAGVEPALDVGAVALDTKGNLAAATSTGGMTGKRWGRVGDAPLIGAGTYADNRACAVSATGWGEFFIRVGVAHEICARIKFSELPPQSIADAVMADVAELGGDGGVILVTPEGQAIFSFNTTGMYRGRATSAGVNEVAIFGGAEKASQTPDH